MPSREPLQVLLNCRLTSQPWAMPGMSLQETTGRMHTWPAGGPGPSVAVTLPYFVSGPLAIPGVVLSSEKD